MGNIKTIHVQCKPAPQGYFKGPIKYYAKRECFVFTLPEWAHVSGVQELIGTDIDKLENDVNKWAKAFEGFGQSKSLVILYDVDDEPPRHSQDALAKVEVAACVCEETIVERPGGKKLYTYVRLEEDDPRAMPADHGRLWIRYEGRGDDTRHENLIPYTPEARAMFMRIFDGVMAIRQMLIDLTRTPAALTAGLAKFEGLPALALPAPEPHAGPHIELKPCPECHWPGGRIEDTDAGMELADTLHRKHEPFCRVNIGQLIPRPAL